MAGDPQIVIVTVAELMRRKPDAAYQRRKNQRRTDRVRTWALPPPHMASKKKSEVQQKNLRGFKKKIAKAFKEKSPEASKTNVYFFVEQRAIFLKPLFFLKPFPRQPHHRPKNL